MPRRPVNSEPVSKRLAEMCRRKKKPARSGPRVDKIRRDVERVRALARDPNKWDEITPTLLVAMYVWLHAEIYGVDPSKELAGKAGLAARGAASRLVAAEFDGDRGKAVEFLRWSWNREKTSEQWRRDNGRDGGRLTWRFQFSPALVTQYRISQARRVDKDRDRVVSARVEHEA